MPLERAPLSLDSKETEPAGSPIDFAGERQQDAGKIPQFLSRAHAQQPETNQHNTLGINCSLFHISLIRSIEQRGDPSFPLRSTANRVICARARPQKAMAVRHNALDGADCAHGQYITFTLLLPLLVV